CHATLVDPVHEVGESSRSRSTGVTDRSPALLHADTQTAHHGLGRLGCRRFERYRCLQVLGTDGFQTSEEVPKPSVVPGTKDLHHGRCTGDTPAAPAFHAESGRAHVAFGGSHPAQSVY